MTAPMICTILPLDMLDKPLILNRCRAADDFRKLFRDRRLAGLVVNEL